MALGLGYLARMSGSGDLGPDIQAWISKPDIRAQICGPENRGPDFGPGCPGLNILPTSEPRYPGWTSGPIYLRLDIWALLSGLGYPGRRLEEGGMKIVSKIRQFFRPRYYASDTHAPNDPAKSIF